MEARTCRDFCTLVLKAQAQAPPFPPAVHGPRFLQNLGLDPGWTAPIVVRAPLESERGQPKVSSRARVLSALGKGLLWPDGKAGPGWGGVRAKASQIPPTVAEKTKEHANAVSEAVVSSVNTVATKTVEEAENIAITSRVVHKVRPGPQPWPSALSHPFPWAPGRPAGEEALSPH